MQQETKPQNYVPPFIIGILISLMAIGCILSRGYPFPEKPVIVKGTITDYNKETRHYGGITKKTKYWYFKVYDYTVDGEEYSSESTVGGTKWFSKNILVLVDKNAPEESIPLVDYLSQSVSFGIIWLLGTFVSVVSFIGIVTGIIGRKMFPKGNRKK